MNREYVHICICVYVRVRESRRGVSRNQEYAEDDAIVCGRVECRNRRLGVTPRKVVSSYPVEEDRVNTRETTACALKRHSLPIANHQLTTYLNLLAEF